MHVLFGRPKGKKKENLEDIVVKGWIITKWTLNKLDGGGSVAWVHLALGRGKWRFPVYAVVKIWFPYSAGNLVTS